MAEVGETVYGRWPEEALDGLENNKHIRYIEERQFDQPFFDLPDEILPWGLDRIDAEIAHDAGNSGNGVDVVISDKGIDADHPDLADNLGDGNVPLSKDECQDSKHPDGNCDEDWDDDSGDSHGTHVAGTVGAIDNDQGVIGVSHAVTLHALKIFPSGDHEAIQKGLKWAADQGYDVVNMSHGGSDSGKKQDGVEYAANRGVLLVAATGNSGCCDNVEYPAAYDEVIAVTNITDDDSIRSDSSRGPEVDIGAPGDAIPSTANDGEYKNLGGTSMASPHVAGAGAQLIADGEDADGARSTLENTAEDIGLSDNEQGNGLLDLANALGHDSANDLTEVETDFADDIQYTEARLNGEVTELTGNDDADVFFQYREPGTTSWTKTPMETVTGTGSFDRTVTGLAEDTAYEFRAGVTVTESSKGWSSTEHGSVVEFDTVDNPDPTASFTHDPMVPDPGDSVEFDASGSDPGEVLGVAEDDSIVGYEWDFGDGTTATTTNPKITHTYSAPGDVTVSLTVTDEFGQTGEATKEIRVNEIPTASFNHSPTVPDEDVPVQFDASASMDPDGTIVEYAWEFGDGNTATTSTPVVDHTYAIGDFGNQTVTLTVTDNDDASDEVSETIRVNAVPEADWDHLPPLPDEDEPVEFDASASMDRDPGFGGEIVEYEWDFGDGTTATTTDPVIEHTYAIGDYGNQTVTLRVTDNDGASHDTLSVHEETIRINAVPEAVFDVVTDPPVRNEPVEFDASASADRDPEFGGEIVEYEWDFGDGTTATTADPVIDHTFTTGGEHTVTLRVTDNDGASHDDRSVHEETFTVYIRVGVAIQPNGSGPNSINPRKNGDVPVAVLNTSAFDGPSRLDHSSVHFGDPDDVGFDTSTDPFTTEGGATPTHSGGHTEDVDDDGDMDSLFHFPNQDGGFESDDSEGKLVGLTNDGVPLFGSDSVNIVGGGGS